MTDSVKNFAVLFKFMNGKINDKDDYLQYQENGKLINKKSTDFNKKIFYVKNKYFNFKISINNNIQEFNVILYNDTINNILINLNLNMNKKRSLVEILIEDSSNQNSDLMVKYNNEKVSFVINYNDLKIGRVIILNSDFNFQLYVMNKSYLDNIKIDKQNNFIDNILNYLKEKNIDISFYKKQLEDIEIDKENKNKIFLGKKIGKNDEIKNSELKEIKFTVEESLISDNMRICIYNNDAITIATIHDMTQTNNNNINKQNIKYDIKDLNSYLNYSNHIINSFVEKIKKGNIEDIISIKIFYSKPNLGENLFQYIDQTDIDNTTYLLFLKDSFEYIYNSIMEINSNIIKNIIEKEKVNIKNNSDLIDFIKKNMINIFSYFDYFQEYIKYLNDEKSNISNLIIPDIRNLTNKEKINILSSIISIMFLSPYFDTNKKIEFYKINNDKINVYYKSKELLFNIIDNLTTDSAFLKGIKKTTSRIKKDLNKDNYPYYKLKDENNNEIFDENIFILEYKKLSELKEDIKSNVPDMIVRFVDTKTLSNAEYDICSGNILINEAIFKKKNNKFLENDDNKLFDEYNNIIKGKINLDIKGNKIKYNLFIFKAFWRLNHESLGHKPISKINRGKDTPSKTILSKTFSPTQDAGEIIEYYIIGNRENEFHTIKNCEYDCSKLLDKSLYINTTFDEFWRVVDDLNIDDNDEEEEKTEKLILFKKIRQCFNNQREIKYENGKIIKIKNNFYFKNKYILSKE